MRTNTGFFAEKRSTDYIFGGVTPVPFEERNQPGDWTQFLPAEERQSGRFVDSMACVTFSAMNSLETQMRWMIQNRLIPDVSMAWLRANKYLDQNDMPNFSDRFTARMSGTTPNGNSIQRVWDSIRKDGVAPEESWPNDLEEFDWNHYYSAPTDEVKVLAKEFLTHFKVTYEFINDEPLIKKGLQHAPLQIATAVCPGWGGDRTISACSLPVSHATLIYRITDRGNYADFDHYDPFHKELAKDYVIPFICKGVLSPIRQSNGLPAVVDGFNRDLVYGERSEDVRKLQAKLQVLPVPTTFYGDLTVAAVRRYMKYNAIGSWFEQNIWPAGSRVGPKIRAVLNKNL